MADVRSCLETEGPAYLLQAIRTLRSHTHDEPLVHIPAAPAWIDRHFPKVRRGLHPRPDLGQSVEPYKKWRADLLRAVARATGKRTEKEQRRAQEDGWRRLITAAKLHSSNGGIIHPASASLVASLADIARRGNIEPRELCGQGAVLDRLVGAFSGRNERAVARKALSFLDAWRFLPQFAAQLLAPMATLPRLRDGSALPHTVETIIRRLVETATASGDPIVGADAKTVSASTEAVYFAALRHHARVLGKASTEKHDPWSEMLCDLTWTRRSCSRMRQSWKVCGGPHAPRMSPPPSRA